MCGPTRLWIPARLAMRRTTLAAPWLSKSSTGAVAEDRTFVAFADSEIDRAGGAWCERDGHGLAALAMEDEGAVTAFETEQFDVRPDRLRHSPFNASSEINAWSRAPARPAATSIAPTSLRSRRSRWTRNPNAVDEHELPGIGRAALPRRRTGTAK